MAHRWLGFATVWLLLGHGVFTTLGFAVGDGSSVPAEFWMLLTTYPYVLMATVSGALFAAVAIMSEDEHPATPASMILMAGPIDCRIAPTRVNQLATENECSAPRIA